MNIWSRQPIEEEEGKKSNQPIEEEEGKESSNQGHKSGEEVEHRICTRLTLDIDTEPILSGKGLNILIMQA